MVTALLSCALSMVQTREYQVIDVEGWTVRVEKSVVETRPNTWKLARKQLQSMLFQVTRTVPDGPLAKPKSVRLYVHLNVPSNPGAAYHPSADWLREHDFDPAMAKGIEFGSVENLVTWSYQQPSMALHELAHAYHDQFLPEGFGNPSVAEAYQAAVDSHKYESVLRENGENQRAYALTNSSEYFAELTEAYFGQNDFFPFIRAELKQFDPKGYEAMRSAWGEAAVKVPKG